MTSQARTLKVFNLTDVATPVLEQRKWVGQVFVVGNTAIAPGEWAEIPDTPAIRKKLQTPTRYSALCVGQPPPTYVRNKATKERIQAIALSTSVPRPETSVAINVIREEPHAEDAGSSSGRKKKSAASKD